MNKSQQLRRLCFFFLATSLILLVIVFWQGITAPKEPAISSKQQEFTIAAGDSFWQISQRLEQQGLIKNHLFFEAYGLLTGQYKKLQPGRYLLSAALNISQIANKIARGDYAPENLTIIEGWTLNNILKQLKEQNLASANDFLQTAGQDFSASFSFLRDKPKELDLEGYLFPDTYQLRINDPAQALINKALRNFEQKFNLQLQTKAQSQGRSIFDIARMASLLEKEVKTYQDKKIVAGILWKRLDSGWPLQIDATVGYLKGKASLELTKEDLALDSEYNTYKHKGLPKGPICNPGLESLRAAVEYQASDYWFYLSKPDGSTVFSKTLAEHNKNREKYLKK